MNEEQRWIRDDYATKAFEFFLEYYFDKDFRRLAYEREVDPHEFLADEAYLLADEMIKRR